MYLATPALLTRWNKVSLQDFLPVLATLHPKITILYFRLGCDQMLCSVLSTVVRVFPYLGTLTSDATNCGLGRLGPFVGILRAIERTFFLDGDRIFWRGGRKHFGQRGTDLIRETRTLQRKSYVLLRERCFSWCKRHFQRRGGRENMVEAMSWTRNTRAQRAIIERTLFFRSVLLLLNKRGLCKVGRRKQQNNF